MNSLLRQQVREKLGKIHNGYPILLILVGESGTGKTTFVRMMNCEENWFESSRAMREALQKRGEPVNHDTIHAFAKRAYRENPRWQVPNIIAALAGKKFLILDGPRKIEEVRALLGVHPRTLIVRILTSRTKERAERLRLRDGIGTEDFKRVREDESMETELGQILALADITIVNDGTTDDLRKTALELKEILQKIE